MSNMIKNIFRAGPQTLFWSTIFATIGIIITGSLLVFVGIQFSYICIVLVIDWFLKSKTFTPDHG